MLTIIGNGIGKNDFSNITFDLNSFDKIICDKSFEVKQTNKILKLSYKEAKEYISAHYKNQNLAYIVTGSPYFFSAGILIAKKLNQSYIKIIDNISSKKYIQERFCISDSEICSISLHGRDRIDLDKFLKNKYTLILCDLYSIKRLSSATKYIRNIEVYIGYKLGYEDEAIEQIDLANISDKFDLKAPYIILIKRLFNSKALSKDSDFMTERGMITKEYKRNLSLQFLDLEPNMILYDIGAGSGSCAIEAYKRYSVKTYLFEKNPTRIEYIKQNLSSHNVADTALLEGNAIDFLDNIEYKPDRIFVGGGGEDVISRLEYLFKLLNDNGIILINLITLKHLNLALNILQDSNIKYELINLSITTHKNSLNIIEPQRALYIIKIIKDKS